MLNTSLTKRSHVRHRTCRLTVSAASSSRNARRTHSHAVSRRQLFGSAAAAAATAAIAGHLLGTDASQALPLAPLGPVERIGDDKLVGVSVEAAKDILTRDLRDGQYFVTGDLTKELFADDCRFVDPTNDVTGLSKYVKALGLLFDPANSQVKLLSIEMTGPSTIEATWTLGGYLRFPWKPQVKEFKGRTVYTLNQQGLIQEQRQTWSISALEALVESFTPTAGPTKA